jgi:hypothetical protein
VLPPCQRAAKSVRDSPRILGKTSKIVSADIAGDLLAVSVEVGGALEVRTFGLGDMKPAGGTLPASCDANGRGC